MKQISIIFSKYEVLSSTILEYCQNIIKLLSLMFHYTVVKPDTGAAPLHRPRGWDRAGRVRRKAMSRTSWYRPHGAVGFYPPTPGRVLPGRLQAAMTEEAARIGVTVKIIEGGGQPLHTTGTSSASTSPSARCGTAGRASPPRRRGGGRQPHPGLRPLSRGLHPVCPCLEEGKRVVYITGSLTSLTTAWTS